MRRVVVVITADPAKSNRALEGLRLSVGLALAENTVRVVLEGPAAALADPSPGSFPGSRSAEEYLDALRELEAEVEVGELPLQAARSADAVIRWGA
jgi:hypothetical protein